MAPLNAMIANSAKRAAYGAAQQQGGVSVDRTAMARATRDLRYWSFETPRLVNAWLALGDETPANGCMRLLPATQHMQLDPKRLDSDQFLREDREDNAELIDTAITAELAPGDVLFFDAGLFHAAGANTTDERKLSVVTTYYGPDNAPTPNSRSARLEPIAVRTAAHA